MKKKELKRLATRMAELEIIIQNSADPYEKQAAQNEILNITSKIVDIEDMLALDEMTQEILEKNF